MIHFDYLQMKLYKKTQTKYYVVCVLDKQLMAVFGMERLTEKRNGNIIEL